MKLYVTSGSLKGVLVEAATPHEAVVIAVKGNLPCILASSIRVSPLPRGAHFLDMLYRAPHEETFPELFDGSIEVETRAVESAE